MKTHLRKLLASFVAAALLAGGSVAAVGDDDARDHELARQALLEGRIRPLIEITAEFKAQFAGEILGVELEVEDKAGTKFVYEFKVLTPDGKLKEVEVDAKTAKILKIEDDD
ncbi:peptidase M4 [Hyphomicrobium methylovorum]|uniref:PepSY domain-containing protein n=1 Tax=Hyphomicrobium methylovorum TaxID=84 RepID=UPI0015E692FA|nr:PepSY domain-containing protein [Hyphomicrobium methylovorum]MBA2125438.1 peptidase M4 [Hyphomicrobium methylovorum]